MNRGWRALNLGDHVHVRDAFGRIRCVRVAAVPADWRDSTGSLATTIRGAFPKAWVQGSTAPVPWPTQDIHWPNHIASDDECRFP